MWSPDIQEFHGIYQAKEFNKMAIRLLVVSYYSIPASSVQDLDLIFGSFSDSDRDPNLVHRFYCLDKGCWVSRPEISISTHCIV